jgi:hypothetical protein
MDLIRQTSDPFKNFSPMPVNSQRSAPSAALATRWSIPRSTFGGDALKLMDVHAPLTGVGPENLFLLIRAHTSR